MFADDLFQPPDDGTRVTHGEFSRGQQFDCSNSQFAEAGNLGDDPCGVGHLSVKFAGPAVQGHYDDVGPPLRVRLGWCRADLFVETPPVDGIGAQL